MRQLPAIATVAILLLTAATAVAGPPSYPLLCQGGPDMKIMTNHDVDSSGVPGDTAMFIHFKPAAKPGEVQKPGPGECVWMDRTFRKGEPTVLWIKSPKIEFAFQVTGDGRVVTDTTGPRLDVDGATLSAEAKKWQHLVDCVLTGDMFTAKVYNEAGRVMVITDVQM